MINMLAPMIVVTTNDAHVRRSWMARIWRRIWPPVPHYTYPTNEILDIIHRVRGAEANLARMQMEQKHREKS